ncbi:gas vesicle protein [Streptomyces sp. RS10V-4]|uniref:gas vesicle protein n=1 Tax=Streptomyces rhizoryzae TaxID=2932493 RepID=UPI002003350A|nr:gas vesicle protein [Streptomyces rhizoryzae]MCK7624359.1 gas vesicle protein [Streptomyces rhizoryzae]
MTAPEGPAAAPQGPLAQRQVALIDLLDRLLSGGVVLNGDLVLSIADVDLVRITLRALIVSISAGNPSPWQPPPASAYQDHDG